MVGEGRRPQTQPGHIPFTPPAKKVLELSLREALNLGDDHIGTEHLLLGLLAEADDVGAQIVARLGASAGAGAGQQPAPAPRQGYVSPGEQIVPPGYQGGQRSAPARAAASGAPDAAAAHPVATRSNGVTGLILGLGSMGLGVGATSVVVTHQSSSAAQFFMVLLIWVAIAVINIAHSQRR